MFSLYGMPGMGASGLGSGAGGQLSPQMIAALAGAGGMGGPGVPTGPMAAYIGASLPQRPMGMPMQPPQVGAPPQLQSPSMSGLGQQQGQGQPGQGQQNPIQQLLGMLGGQQSGVIPQGQQNHGLMSILGNLLGGYGANGMPGSGVMDGLNAQALQNIPAFTPPGPGGGVTPGGGMPMGGGLFA